MDSKNDMDNLKKSLMQNAAKVAEKVANKVASFDSVNTNLHGWRGYEAYQLYRFTFTAKYRKDFFVEE